MEKKIIITPDAPQPIGPYNQAILVNGTLYCSGQIALDPKTGTMVQDSIEAETNMVMQNVGAVLKASDMDYGNIVKTSIFISDMNQFGRINETYAKYFEKDFPARETVQVSRLPKDANVEISVVAVK
jgi:2-iminobutanoate/2-iminopropanoate deaminase